MVQLAGYLTVIFHALALAGLAASVGGAVFCLAVLRPAAAAAGTPLEVRLLGLSARGALLAALAFGGVLLAGPWGLADEGGAWPMREYLDTGFARSSLLRLALVLAFGGALWRLRGRATSRRLWTLALAAMTATIVSGAWTVHAVSRLEHALPLMVTTILHETAAEVWCGGVLALVLCAGARGAGDGLWPRLLARFSPLGLACVTALCGAGGWIAWHYLGDLASLVGTNYGVMIIAKLLLFAVALTLATLNFRHTRRWRATGDGSGATTRVPVYVEAELVALLAIMLLGASLAATPPAVDLATERATLAEVAETLAAKPPQLVPPDYSALIADYASPLAFFEPSTAVEHVQSNFNHNVSGLFMLLIGALAIAHRLGLAQWARHWPLLFLPFALFLQLIVQPTGWPLGPEGFLEQLRSPAVLQHRLATLLPLAVGVMEWRVQAGALAATRWRYTFPVLCFVGGAVLLTHTHAALGTKEEFLIEVSHAGIAICALLAGIGRWLELRLPPPAPRFCGALWTASLLLMGLLLLFYRE